MINHILEEIEKNPDLAQSYKELFKALETEDLAKEEAKLAEDKLRADIAIINGAYKKDGTTADEASVKMGSLNGALAVYKGEKDKLEEAAALKEEYLSLFNSGEITKGQIEGIDTKRNTLKETKDQVKDTKDKFMDTMDAEIVEGLLMVAKEELLLIKANQDDGDGKVKKPKKTVPFEVIKALKEKLGK